MDQPMQSFAQNRYYQETSNYFDGLGRLLQTVNKQAHAEGYDIITSHIYDSTGREAISYLPYTLNVAVPSFNTGQFRPLWQSEIQNFYAPSSGEEPYSIVQYDQSPLNRPIKTMSPGHSWVGSNRGVITDYLTNPEYTTFLLNGTASQDYLVKGSWPRYILNTGGNDAPLYQGDYDPGELYIVRTKDEDGNLTEEAKDKQGRVVIKRTFSGGNATYGTPGGVNNNIFPDNWAYTIFVYNDLGQLVYVLPPDAVKPYLQEQHQTSQGLNQSTFFTFFFPDISQSVADGLCYHYVYDGRGRVVEKKIPGKEKELYVYDLRDRLVFSQDGNLRQNQNWLFNVYDGLNRNLFSGKIMTGNSRTGLQSLVTDNSGAAVPDVLFYIKNYKLWHTAPYAYPTTISLAGNQGTIFNLNYYDDYTSSGLTNFSFPAGEFPGTNLVTVLPSEFYADAKGKPTGASVRVFDPDNPNADIWLKSANYYDYQGRLIQTQSENLHQGTDVFSTIYYFSGQPYKQITDHHNPDAVGIPGANDVLNNIRLETTTERNYNLNGGNDLVWHLQQKINNGNPYDVAYYSYDHLGRVVVKQFTIGNELREYNVRGFLNHILIKNPTSSLGEQFFEENLYYDKGFSSKLYNGNIAGITWKDYAASTFTMPPTRAYGYAYDPMNRLKYAEYREYDAMGWNKSAHDYTVSNLDYDLNGNILSMNQRGVITHPIDMDQLSYTYAPNSNQLIKVADAINPDSTVGLPDFKDGSDQSVEYEYDQNGNLISDANKNISSITYNYLNKPEKITVDGQGTISYVYDALGNKLQMRVDDTQNNSKVYDYIGNFVYENNMLQYILNDEGRARPVIPEGGTGETKFVYDYFLKDHLGNVRSVVTANPVNPEYLAKHEIASANIENLFFDNIPAVRADKPGSTDPADTKAAELNGSDPNRTIGTAIMLRVMPGDRFEISTDAYYEGDSGDEGTVDPGTIVGTLLSTLTGGVNYNNIPVRELPENIQTIENIFGNPELPEAINQLSETTDDPARPKAHLNYLVFNDEMRLDPENSGALQVPMGGNGWTTMQKEVQIQTPGYIFVYVDNQSLGKDVWFDNIHLEHYTSQVLEQNHYYPYGLTISQDGAGTGAEQPYKYNGKELVKDFGLESYDYGARIYDPQIGRWKGVDELATEFPAWSPYNSAMNNPINLIDPDGRAVMPPDWVQDADQEIYWDKNATSRSTTKKGETYLGKTLTFEFISYIDKKLWDGPTMGGLVDPSGDKLISKITLTGNDNSSGELTSITAKMWTKPGETPIGTARDFYPGEGGSNNVFSLKGTGTGINLNFEQHASVSPSEEFGLNSMGYKIVDVAQKLNINYTSSTGKLSVSAYTNVFPSATLKINGTSIMHYDQPSFKATHTAPIKGWTTPNPYKDHSWPRPIRDFSYYPSRFYKR